MIWGVFPYFWKHPYKSRNKPFFGDGCMPFESVFEKVMVVFHGTWNPQSDLFDWGGDWLSLIYPPANRSHVPWKLMVGRCNVLLKWVLFQVIFRSFSGVLKNNLLIFSLVGPRVSDQPSQKINNGIKGTFDIPQWSMLWIRFLQGGPPDPAIRRVGALGPFHSTEIGSMVVELVPLKGGIGGIVHPPIGRKNATYISLIVLAKPGGWKMLPIPPFRGTRNNHWLGFAWVVFLRSLHQLDPKPDLGNPKPTNRLGHGEEWGDPLPW